MTHSSWVNHISSPAQVQGFLNGGALLSRHDVAIPQMPLNGSGHQFEVEACPHVCGEAHPSGLRDRGADDGVHALHEPRSTPIMKSSWRVSVRGLVTVRLGVQVFIRSKLVSRQVSQLDDYLSSSWPSCSVMVFRP